MKMHPERLSTPFQTPLFYVGQPLKKGLLPAFFYFALSGEESLSLEPYNSPVLPFLKDEIRVFSFTIPGHGPGFDKLKAMEVWADWAFEGRDFLSPFFDEVISTIDWLVGQKIVDQENIAFGGLSRGGLVATHLAARQKQVKTLLAFAPLTRLITIKEFQAKKSLAFLKQMESFDLKACSENLLHLKNLRFYIGNRDKRVSTDACYHFIRELTDLAHERRARAFLIEMRITPSIGYKGHGTTPETFYEGADWIKKCLKRL